MLTRAARRHAQHRLTRHLRAAALEQLSLPWLSAACHTALDFRRSSSALGPSRSPHRHRAATQSQLLSVPCHARCMASEALHLGQDRSPTDYSSDAYVPFDHPIPLENDVPNRFLQPPGIGLPRFPRTKSSVNKTTLILPEERGRMSPRVTARHGMLGDSRVLHESLYALVRVGRFTQAERVIRRLGDMYPTDAPELLDAHHRYLTGRLASLHENPSPEVFAHMQKWFELDIRGRQSAPNSGILAVMIKAAFVILQGSRLDRTIRRFLNIAEQQGPIVRDEVSSSNLFSDSEWLTLVRLQPQHYQSPDHIIAEADIPQQMNAIASANKDPSLLPKSPQPAPELRAADLKGLGLKALKMSLGSFTTTTSTETSDHERQVRLERDVLQSAIQRWREEAENTQVMRIRGHLSNPLLGAHAYDWIQEMKAIIKSDIARTEANECTSNTRGDIDIQLLSPFLKLADAEKLSAASVIEFISAAFNVRTKEEPDRHMSTMVSRLGAAILQEIKMSARDSSILEQFHSLPSTNRHKTIHQLRRKKDSRRETPAATRFFEDEEASKSLQTSPQESGYVLSMKMGAYFLSLLIKVAKLPVSRTDPSSGKIVTEFEPAIKQDRKWENGKRIGIVVSHKELIARLKREPVGTFIAKHLPMLVPPQPWTDVRKGGYLETPMSAVRFRDSSRAQHKYLDLASKRGDMKQTYAALDVVGKVPWRINRPVFNVIAEVWNSGEAIGGLAPHDPPETWPEKPASEDVAAIRRWKTLVRTMMNERTGLHSQRCYQNFQLEVARSYLNETFYCPHSADFRGRAYPIPPYFNHMGADYVRGLFLFANGRQLGSSGLRWLKIHVANVYGFDKANLLDREKFTMDHIEDVYDSAANPLGGKRWWLTAEDPWQCLAACMEVKNALDSPNPTEFVSHLPIHQDGTCNGLQHYAALGGDSIGARQVNLMPGDRPADIYSAVADIVKADVAKAAADGHKLAQALDGKITRKVVKQPVMTNVYGVTYHGARAQVVKQLVDIMPKNTLSETITNQQLASYIANLIFKALERMFTGASAIQNWLGECGALISQSVTHEQIERIRAQRTGTAEPAKKTRLRLLPDRRHNTAAEDYQFKSTIVWTTPLGMPVVQPYREPKLKAISTSLQDIFVQDATMGDAVSKRKQLQGFPPNFIHSLDATHMMLSALKCDEIGLQFSSVHDSFWTHAADVHMMNRILRDAFVRVHSENVIGRLREEFIARYEGCITYVPLDARCKLAKDITLLRRAKTGACRAFLTGKVKEGRQIDELLEEHERCRLLKSDDPDERERGRQMVTPASLFEAADPGAAKFAAPLAGETSVAGLGARTDVPRETKDQLDVEEMESDELSALEDLDAEDDHEDLSLVDAAGQDEVNAETDEVKSPPRPLVYGRPRKHVKHRVKRVYLWMPITFPETPAKGDFDVASLKDSTYFFS